MPSHAPNHCIVRLVNLVEHAAAEGLPENDLAVVRGRACAHKKFLFKGVPGKHRDLFVMALKTIKLFVGAANVENFDLLVPTARQKPISIDGVPAHLTDCVVVSWNRVHAAAALSRVPNLAEVIFAAC